MVGVRGNVAANAECAPPSQHLPDRRLTLLYNIVLRCGDCDRQALLAIEARLRLTQVEVVHEAGLCARRVFCVDVRFNRWLVEDLRNLVVL